MKNPKFSIIIPAHNEEDLIEKAVKSIQRQTFQNFEIIISNDGSTDKTKEIVENLMKKDKKIRILNRVKSHSAAFARNRGAEIAKGEILLFLDADTFLNKIALEKINNSSGKADAFAMNCFATKNSIINYALSGLTIPVILKKEIYSQKDPNAPMFFVMTKNAYEQIGGYDERIFYFEDENLAKEFYKKGLKLIFVKEAEQYFELPSSFKGFLRQCQWIAKGTHSLKNKKEKRKKKTSWYLKFLFLISPLFFLSIGCEAFFQVLIVTAGISYLSLIKRNKNPIKSLVSLIFLYLKIFYVNWRLLKR